MEKFKVNGKMSVDVAESLLRGGCITRSSAIFINSLIDELELQHQYIKLMRANFEKERAKRRKLQSILRSIYDKIGTELQND